MPLNTEEAIAILQQIIGAEIAATQHLGLRRQLHHLILMTDQNIQLCLEGLHPALAFDHLIERHAYAPALV